MKRPWIRKEILDRQEYLRRALFLSRDRNILTAGQRTLVHQEIAAWYRVLDKLDADDYGENPRYRLPAKIEEIVTYIHNSKINSK